MESEHYTLGNTYYNIKAMEQKKEDLHTNEVHFPDKQEITVSSDDKLTIASH